MKRYAAMFVVLVTAVVLAIAAWVWFSSSGVGEYADSPDGRFTAHVSSLRRGTWFHGSVDYIEVILEDSATGKPIWIVQRYLQPGEVPMQYGDRSKKFIKWSPDSKSFSAPVGGAADSVWNAP